MKRQHVPDVNTPDNYDKIYFGERTVQLMPPKFLAQLLPILVKGGKVLDLGCGLGRFFPFLKGAEITGLDFTQKVLDQAKADHADLNPTITLQDVAKNGLDCYEDNSFDFIFCGEVIEHMENPQALIDEMHRVVKKGGVVITTTPYQDRIVCDEHLWEYDYYDLEKLYAGFEYVAVSRFYSVYEADWEHFIVISQK